jgi:hypothetical protein
MPCQNPEPGPDDEQAATLADQRYLDWQALLDALAAGGLLDGDPDGQDQVAAAGQAAVAEGRMGAPLPPGQAGALAVEHMPPGPGAGRVAGRGHGRGCGLG